ncbi:MAG TPA: hypothetical protein VFE62_08395 [Gemmataceae bacterium]|nr:hypothetical protein [Pirellulales bacterium]HZZ78523.1 hypothetical protein [Gemmataceae bacterium]
MNKSDHVRRYLSQHPSAKPKEIFQGLQGEGVDVSMALINRIKYGPESGRKGKRGRRGRRTAAAATNGHQLSLEHLLAAKKLVDQLGSVQSAKQAVDALAKLS